MIMKLHECKAGDAMVELYRLSQCIMGYLKLVTSSLQSKWSIFREHVYHDDTCVLNAKKKNQVQSTDRQDAFYLWDHDYTPTSYVGV